MINNKTLILFFIPVVILGTIVILPKKSNISFQNRSLNTLFVQAYHNDNIIFEDTLHPMEIFFPPTVELSTNNNLFVELKVNATNQFGNKVTTETSNFYPFTRWIRMSFYQKEENSEGFYIENDSYIEKPLFH